MSARLTYPAYSAAKPSSWIFLVLSGWLMCASALAQQPAGADVREPQGPVPNEAPGGPVPLRTVPQPPKPPPAKGSAATQPDTTTQQPTPGATTQPAQPAAAPAPPAVQAAPAPATDKPVASAAAPAHKPAPAPSGLSSDRLFIPAVATIGAGSAMLLASLFTGIGAHGIYNQLERDCKDNLCPSSSADKLDSGKTLAVVSTVLTGVGIVAVGAGAALLIIAKNRSGDADSERAHVRLTPAPTVLGLGARADF